MEFSLAKVLEIKIKNWETSNMALERKGLKDLVDVFLTQKTIKQLLIWDFILMIPSIQIVSLQLYVKIH